MAPEQKHIRRSSACRNRKGFSPRHRRPARCRKKARGTGRGLKNVRLATGYFFSGTVGAPAGAGTGAAAAAAGLMSISSTSKIRVELGGMFWRASSP